MSEHTELNCHCRKCGCNFSYLENYEYAIDAIVCPQCKITQFRNIQECVIDTPDDYSCTSPLPCST